VVDVFDGSLDHQVAGRVNHGRSFAAGRAPAPIFAPAPQQGEAVYRDDVYDASVRDNSVLTYEQNSGGWDAGVSQHQPGWDAGVSQHQPGWDAGVSQHQPGWDAGVSQHQPGWDAGVSQLQPGWDEGVSQHQPTFMFDTTECSDAQYQHAIASGAAHALGTQQETMLAMQESYEQPDSFTVGHRGPEGGAYIEQGEFYNSRLVRGCCRCGSHGC